MSDLHAINDAINKRAGRKLLPSIATSLSLMAAVWALLKYFPAGFAALVALALVLAIKELAHAFSSSDTYVSKRSLMISAVGLSAGAWFGGIRGLAIGLGIALIVMLIGLLRKGTKGFVKSASASVFALVYLPFLTGFLILLARPHNGLEQIMVFVILVASNDTFAYVFGVLFGKRPMAPEISPKKTWEGFAGSLIFTTVLGYLSFNGILNLNPWIGAAVGLLIVFTATTGDLIESAIKRDFAIKDMGDLLPGHGGVMDRLDSIITSAPALWVVLELVKYYS
jgi:phosphatidate cytidylyltransferase